MNSSPDPAARNVARARGGWMPGVVAAASAALLAWCIHALVPAIPLLTAAVVLGILVAQLPVARPALTGALAAGLSVSAKRLMRIGIVLLGLKLSLVDIFGLGWVTVLTVIGIVLITFGGTLWLGRLFGLPGHQPLLIATGFAICGASAIGAMSGVVKAKDEDTATPVALVTLCGTLAIAVLPALWHPLHLTAEEFGQWVGAGVHDVGQVVATAQVAGSAALAVAVVVKLTRVVMLAPMVAATALVVRRRGMNRAKDRAVGGQGAGEMATLPPIVPLFVAGFLCAILARTLFVVPDPVLVGADIVQTALLAMALFGLGTAVRLRELLGTGWRSLVVGLLSWLLIAALAFGAVALG